MLKNEVGKYKIFGFFIDKNYTICYGIKKLTCNSPGCVLSLHAHQTRVARYQNSLK